MTAPKLCIACGRTLRATQYDTCGSCRRNTRHIPCTRCGQKASHGNTVCGGCRDLDEIEATKVVGWNRGPRGTLVGSFKPCNGTPCTEHAFCGINREDAA